MRADRRQRGGKTARAAMALAAAMLMTGGGCSSIGGDAEIGRLKCSPRQLREEVEKDSFPTAAQAGMQAGVVGR